MDLYEELTNLKIPYIDNYVITHPKYEWLMKKFHLWAHENNVDISFAIKYNYGQWIAQTYPYCKSEYRLLNILKITYILFAIDDEIDLLIKSGNTQILNNYFDILSETLKNPQKSNEGISETCIMFGKIWFQISKYFTNNQIKLISTSINDWFVLSNFLASNYRMKNRYIPVSTYVEYRRVDYCPFVYMYFIEYALEFELKDHIRESYPIKQLQILTGDRFFIAHDMIAGLPVEYMDGEIMNYVFAVKYENQCSFQEAVDRTYLKIKTLDEEIKRCEQNIKTDSYILAKQPMIKEYVSALNIMAYGFIEWNTTSVRYTIEHISVKDVNWIQLKQNIENNSKLSFNSDPPLKAIIGENNSKIYLL